MEILFSYICIRSIFSLRSNIGQFDRKKFKEVKHEKLP